MKNKRNYLLSLLIIILLFSCNKNADKKEANVSQQEIANENPVNNQKIYEPKWKNENEFEEMMKKETIAAEVLNAINDGEFYNYDKNDYSSFKTENVSKIDEIISAQGYYIQHSKNCSPFGRSPEILVLSVKDENVYIKEIDFVNEQTITRNEISLQFDGKTFSYNKTKLEKQKGNIQIIYLEHCPERLGKDLLVMKHHIHLQVILTIQ